MSEMPTFEDVAAQVNKLTVAVAAIEDRFKPPPPPSKDAVHHQQLSAAVSSLSSRLANPFVFTVAYGQVVPRAPKVSPALQNRPALDFRCKHLEQRKIRRLRECQFPL